MAGDAYATIESFWKAQDDGDYTATVNLFADDAEFVDPVYGTFSGRQAIGEFMAKMNQVVGAINGSFRLVDLAGDDTAAWAQWVFNSDKGERFGVGIYRVANGKITYYRDYMDPAES